MTGIAKIDGCRVPYIAESHFGLLIFGYYHARLGTWFTTPGMGHNTRFADLDEARDAVMGEKWRLTWWAWAT